MKKLFLFLISVLVMGLFVACNSNLETDESQSEQLAYATFSQSSKDLSSSYSGYEAYSNLWWYYTSSKTDAFGITGQSKDTKTAVSSSKGLSGKVGPFSEGTWTFSLYAYKGDSQNNEDANLVYSGTNDSVTIRRNQTNYIPVTVSPQGTNGFIKFNSESGSKAYFNWNNGSASYPNLYLNMSYIKDGSTQGTFDSMTLRKDSSDQNKYYFGDYDSNYYIKENLSENIATGVYTVTFKVQDALTANNPTYTFQEYTMSFKVMGGLTVIISGNIVEGLSYENYFVVPEIETKSFESASTSNTITMDVAPIIAKTDETKTTVTFEAGALDSNTQHNLGISVESINVASQKSYSVIEGETAVASVDLTLTKIVTTGGTVSEETVTTFNDNKEVYISTYIEKGLSGVYVYYDGSKLSSEDFNPSGTPEIGSATGYNSSTGLLVFKTKHFSNWYVSCTAAVQNTTTNKFYGTLEAAIKDVVDGNTLMLLSNVTVKLNDTTAASSGCDKSLWIEKNNVTVDLNEKKLIIKNNYGGANNVLNFIGKGCTLKDGTIVALRKNEGQEVDQSDEYYDINYPHWDSYAFAAENTDGVVYVDNVSFSGGIALYSGIFASISNATRAKATNYYVVYVESGAIAEILNGSFDGPLCNGGGSISIKGGTFTVEPTSYVASGYTATYDEGSQTWTVTENVPQQIG